MSNKEYVYYCEELDILAITDDIGFPYLVIPLERPYDAWTSYKAIVMMEYVGEL